MVKFKFAPELETKISAVMKLLIELGLSVAPLHMDIETRPIYTIGRRTPTEYIQTVIGELKFEVPAEYIILTGTKTESERDGKN